jgi:ABC-type nitrate/sulfonate/bicarbonate transport system substrate-binding protein
MDSGSVRDAVTRRELLRQAAGAAALVTLEPVAGSSAKAQATIELTHAEAGNAMIFLPIYVAQARGFFEREGLAGGADPRRDGHAVAI